MSLAPKKGLCSSHSDPPHSGTCPLSSARQISKGIVESFLFSPIKVTLAKILTEESPLNYPASCSELVGKAVTLDLRIKNLGLSI